MTNTQAINLHCCFEKAPKRREVKTLTDTSLIELYNQRDESAIAKTAEQYGAYCEKIAMNILRNREDADECVNDVYMKMWESIPPACPESFIAYIGRIARNLSINRHKSKNAKKRGGTAIMLDELSDCLPSSSNTEDESDARRLGELINTFLDSVKEDEMLLFVRRYWYADSVNDLKLKFDMSESRIKTILFRTRNKLKDYLTKEGIMI